MRKAIALADYHLHQVKSYKSEVYLRGTLNVLKLPKLISRQIKKQADIEVKAGSTFLEESFSERGLSRIRNNSR